MKKTERKFRNFAVQRSYSYETHDKDGNVTSDITEAEWREKVIFEINSLNDNSEISDIFYVFHDKDINDDGTIRGLHVHLLVAFKNPHGRAFVVNLLSSFCHCKPFSSNCVDYFRNK